MESRSHARTLTEIKKIYKTEKTVATNKYEKNVIPFDISKQTSTQTLFIFRLKSQKTDDYSTADRRRMFIDCNTLRLFCYPVLVTSSAGVKCSRHS